VTLPRPTRCPFCGGLGRIERLPCRVVCTICGAAGPVASSTEAARRAWDTRTQGAGVVMVATAEHFHQAAEKAAERAP